MQAQVQNICTDRDLCTDRMNGDAAVVLVKADSTTQTPVIRTDEVSQRLASDSEGRLSQGKI